MAGEKIPGVEFFLNDPIKIVNGVHKGDKGSVISILNLIPEPKYLIENSMGKDLEVKQSEISKISR